MISDDDDEPPALLKSFSTKKSNSSSGSQSSGKPNLQYYIGKSAKYVVSCAVALVLLISASPLPLYYTVISTLNSTLGKILKLTLKQPRPAQSHKRSYGMPSTHSLAVVYFCVVIIGKSEAFLPKQPYWGRYLLNTAAVVYSILACSWRVTSHLHSLEQVLVGSFMGGSVAYLALLQESHYLIWFEKLQKLTSFPIKFVLSTTLALWCIPLVFKKEVRKVKEWIKERAGWQDTSSVSNTSSYDKSTKQI